VDECGWAQADVVAALELLTSIQKSLLRIEERVEPAMALTEVATPEEGREGELLRRVQRLEGENRRLAVQLAAHQSGHAVASCHCAGCESRRAPVGTGAGILVGPR